MFDSQESLDHFIASWRAGTLPKSDWTHAAHVAVCAVYVIEFGTEALDRMRQGILSYNQAVGTVNSDHSGYHETLTRFWIDRIAAEIAEEADPLAAVAKAVAKFGSRRDIFRDFYSFDVVCSVEARRTWVPPDRLG